MVEKIYTFIYNINMKKLLLLHNNPENPIHGGDIWYSVTGAKEECDLSLEDTVKREIKEETSLDVYGVSYLDDFFEYENYMGKCKEFVYIAFTTDDSVVLNEEWIGYCWCNVDEYIEKTYWYYDKKNLKDILNSTINMIK